MKTMQNVRRVMLAAVMIIACTASFAQHGHHVCAPHMVYSRPAVVTVVTRPALSTRMSNWLSRQDSLDIALAYLANNKYLNISKYSKMTGLSKDTAEAGLDAFAASDDNPIKVVIDGRKKRYTIVCRRRGLARRRDKRRIGQNSHQSFTCDLYCGYRLTFCKSPYCASGLSFAARQPPPLHKKSGAALRNGEPHHFIC